MIHRKILLASLIFVLAGCNMKPLNVLGSKKMVNVIYDMTLTDAVIESNNIIESREKEAYYENVYIKNKTTKKKFENSLIWYAHNPKKLEVIYKEVKTRLDNLNADVENYKFHPESRIKDELSNLDTIEIYHFKKEYHFTQTPKQDSLLFVLDNSAYFEISDRLILEFLMTVNDLDTESDTLKKTKVEFKIIYSDGTNKKLTNKIYANNITYRYKFFPVAKSNVKPVSVECNLFNSNEIISELKIDSIRLLRIYNEAKYPLPEYIRQELDTSIKLEDFGGIRRDRSIFNDHFFKINKK